MSTKQQTRRNGSYRQQEVRLSKNKRSEFSATSFMAPVWSLVWALVCLGLLSAQQVQASGVFEINFASLVDSYGRDLRDDCCSWQNYTNQLTSNQAYQQQCDPTKCQLIIRICVKNYQTQIDPSQCTFGELSAQVMKPNEPAQYAHYPLQYVSALRNQPLPATTTTSGTGANLANFHHQHQLQAATSSSSPRRIMPHQSLLQPTNIHHQRMLFQQQQQSPLLQQFTPASSQSSSSAAYYPHVTNLAHQQHHRQHHSRYFPSSGQPRAMRTMAFHQPITFPFNFTWPGSFSLIIDAWYESPTGLQQVALPFAPVAPVAREQSQLAATTTYDLYKKQLIIKHSMHGWLSVKNEWTNDVHKTDAATLAYSYRVTCQPNYYGEQCNILCRPRDDVYGHYTCSQQGNVLCLPGWQGSNYCLDPICSPGCQQGNCSRPNECNCRLGWQGSSCEQCIRYPGCVHGSCNKPHECNCEEGWGGLLCNEDLNFCTNHQPCKNGALCSNTFDSNGIGSYTCACTEGFTGKNCEKLSVASQQQNPQQQQLLQQPASAANQSKSNGSQNNQHNHHTATTTNPREINVNNQVLSSRHTKQQQQQQQQVPQNTNNVLGLFIPPYYPQPSLQQAHQQPLDQRVIVAYGIIIVCMVILVVLLFLRIFFERTLRRQWHQESSHVEDVATMQNHQNIYKSRTSLSTDKVPFDTVDNGCPSSASSTSSTASSSIEPVNGVNHDRRLRSHHLSHHDLRRHENPLIPPPPYTISHSHPNSTYNNSTYNSSIYNHPSQPNLFAISSNAPSDGTSTAAATSSIYNNSTNSPYANQATTNASTNPYGSTNSTYQSPRYVIYHFLPS